MNRQTSKVRISRVAAALGIAGALVMTSGRAGIAQSSQSASGHGLEGTWLVQVTVRNCATNAALGSFNSLVSFQGAAR